MTLSWAKATLAAVLLLGILFESCFVVQRIIKERPNSPAFTPRMTVDSEMYLVGAIQLSASRGLKIPDQPMHCVPIRMLLAVWYRWFGRRTMFTFKFLNAFLWLTSAFLLWGIVQKQTGSFHWGLWAAFLTCASSVYGAYTATLQYENLLALLVLLFFFVETRETTRLQSVVSGLLLVALCAFRFTFLSLVPMAILLRRSKTKSHLFDFLIAFFIPALIWNGLLSANYHRPYFFFSIGAYNLQRYLNQNAAPYNFPFYRPKGPVGLHFIMRAPIPYLRLLFGHFLYLFGIKDDLWFFESFWVTQFHSRFQLATVPARVTLFVIQFFFLVRGWQMGRFLSNTKLHSLLPWLVFTLLVPHLTLGGSTRFLVPFIPVFVFYQVLGMRSTVSWAKAFVPAKPWSSPFLHRLHSKP